MYLCFLKMKKVLLFILTLAYIASTSGATICIQQCMGKTIGWSFTQKTPEQCTKCGMHKNASNDCCQGHIKVLKVHNDQTLPEVYLNKISLPVAFLPRDSYRQNRLNFSPENFKYIHENRPPPNNDYSILYCTFRV